MSTRSLPPPRGPCRNLPRRRRRPAAMLPPLPRTLRCLELAYGCGSPTGRRVSAGRLPEGAGSLASPRRSERPVTGEGRG